MGGGLVGDNIGLNEEVTKKTCSLSFKAHNSAKEPYISELFRTSSDLTEYLVISFPGSWVETLFLRHHINLCSSLRYFYISLLYYSCIVLYC